MPSFDEFVRDNKRRMHEDRLHRESLQAQRDLIESNKQVAEEVAGVRESLQSQIDDNKEQIELTQKQNKQTNIIAIVSAIISALSVLTTILIRVFA